MSPHNVQEIVISLSAGTVTNPIYFCILRSLLMMTRQNGGTGSDVIL